MSYRNFKFILSAFLVITFPAAAGGFRFSEAGNLPGYPAEGKDTLLTASKTLPVNTAVPSLKSESYAALYTHIDRLPVSFDTLRTAKEVIPVRSIAVSWGYNGSGRRDNIDAIIVHSSYNTLDPDSFNVPGVIEQYRRFKVSSHYLIDKDGNVIRLVDEGYNAYHAGKSRLPDGRENVNSSSIGIEIINTVKSPPAKAQYTALAKLIRNIQSRYKIKYVLGHSDIAPERKSDPWNFDWKLFRQEQGKTEAVSLP